jgi:hypothetical protein
VFDDLPSHAQVFTIIVDVNVLVAAQNANRAGRTATISQRTLDCLADGEVNGRPVQLAVSFKMIDTFRDGLKRKNYAPHDVDAAAEATLNLMRYGPRRLDPYVIFGGTPDPSLLDVEDGSVLATAFAAGADILITDNLSDFTARNCETWKTSVLMRPNGSRRQLSCQIQTRPDGRTLMVVNPADFAHWVERRFEISPDSLRTTFGGETPQPKKGG